MFKALENSVIICCRLSIYGEMVKSHQALLKLINKVARNDVTDAINHILEDVSDMTDDSYRKQMYECTLEILRTNNERLWFNTSIKLARIYLEKQDYPSLEKLIKELKASCEIEEGEYDTSKGNLLEVFAIEIQMCTALKNNKRLRMLYPQTLNLNSVINDPRVMGIIKECGAKMFMHEKQWEKALEEMFESFKNFQEAGNPRAKTVLKYVVLASILSASSINYCDTREAKVYKDDPEIVAIMNLRTAYEHNDINQIQWILNDKSARLLEDAFIKSYLDDLLRNIRLNILVAKIKPYKSVSLQFLAQEINI